MNHNVLVDFWEWWRGELRPLLPARREDGAGATVSIHRDRCITYRKRDGSRETLEGANPETLSRHIREFGGASSCNILLGQGAGDGRERRAFRSAGMPKGRRDHCEQAGSPAQAHRMKFLVDECLSPALAKMALREGYGGSSHVAWLKLSDLTDWELKPIILTEEWTFITKNSVDFRGPKDRPARRANTRTSQFMQALFA
jgi:hypothetical protein